MKKITSILIVMAMLLVMSSSAFAAGIISDGAEIALGTNGASNTLTVGLSPKVVAYYFTDGTTTQTAQWFAIGAVHPGGTEMFGTAQNLTNTYTQDYTAGTTINAALFGLPTGPNSASEWSDNGWEL